MANAIFYFILSVMPLTYQPPVSTLVKELRRRLQLSQEGLAERMGTSFSTVNRWENGRSHPSPMALKLIEFLLKDMGESGTDLLELYFTK